MSDLFHTIDLGEDRNDIFILAQIEEIIEPTSLKMISFLDSSMNEVGSLVYSNYIFQLSFPPDNFIELSFVCSKTSRLGIELVGTERMKIIVDDDSVEASLDNFNFRYIQIGNIGEAEIKFDIKNITIGTAELDADKLIPPANIGVKSAILLDTTAPLSKVQTSLTPFIQKTNTEFECDITTSLSALNFSSIQNYDDAFLIPGDQSSELCAETRGFLRFLGNYGFTGYSTATYPFNFLNSDTYNIWIRTQNPTGRCCIKFYSGETFLDQIDEIDIKADGFEWEWKSISVPIISGTQDLKLEIYSYGTAIEKIVVTSDPSPITGDGPNFTESNLLTVIGQTYLTDGTDPTYPLSGFDYLTSKNGLKANSWYSFHIYPKDNSEISRTYTEEAFVLSVVGSTGNNYVMWNFANDEDEYSSTFRSKVKY